MLPIAASGVKRILFWSTALLIFASVFAGCGEAVIVGKEEAESLAKSALVDFAKNENIPFSSLRGPKSSYNEKTGFWMVSYVTTTAPRYEIDMLVDKSGRVDVTYNIIGS